MSTLPLSGGISCHALFSFSVKISRFFLRISHLSCHVSICIILCVLPVWSSIYTSAYLAQGKNIPGYLSSGKIRLRTLAIGGLSVHFSGALSDSFPRKFVLAGFPNVRSLMLTPMHLSSC